MTKEAIIITLISSIISGILATAITLYVNYKKEQIKVKRDLVDDVFGYRYQLSANGVHIDKSGIMKALNRIPIVFDDNEEVLKAYDKLHDVASMNLDPTVRNMKMDDALITLYKEMCKAAGIKVSNWNDSRIKNIFNVN